jgi:uncharacterized protein YdcH (DUF465 family)
MTQVSYITAEFPGDLLAIQRLRSEDSAFSEICDDLELLGRDLALFSDNESLPKQGAYFDILESILALRQELVEFLQRDVKSSADEV